MSDKDASDKGEQKNVSVLTIKTRARICLVQALYQIHITNDSWEKVVRDFAIKEQERAKQWAYFIAYVEEAKKAHFQDFDDMIIGALPENWKFDRMNALLLSILRAALFEFVHFPETPKAVLISEYLNISHAFFDQDEPRFVNGILQAIASRLRG